jgi:alpha-1,3-glucan synthase
MLSFGPRLLVLASALAHIGSGLRYDPDQVAYNLNQEENAIDPLDYWGEWSDHNYTASPDNWRFPIYTLSLDRWSNGDPTNDDANGTAFEHDWMSNQFRFGGDALGLIDDLDYIQGMGIKAIYFMVRTFCLSYLLCGYAILRRNLSSMVQ